jgi:hypothetical protein
MTASTTGGFAMTRLLVCLATLVFTAGCAAPLSYVPKDAAASLSAPQVRTGDYWEYAVRDGYTKLPRGNYRYEVTRADENGVVVQLTHEGLLMDTLVYAPGWNGRELPLTNTQRFRYDPTYTAYAYPLEPGKSWRSVVRSTDVATGRSYNTHVLGKVLGWERVSVPAGEFDALKIERSVFAGNMEGSNTQEEIRETDWYAPSVRRSVRTHTSSQHFDTSRGGGNGGGEYPLRVRGDNLVSELVSYSR